jgi:nucleoside 2-deoxyribosyltransferase
MKEFLLYCAGPILGTSYEESAKWRKYVAKKLPPYIKAVSPLRGKNYLIGETNMQHSHEDMPLSSRKGIVCRDRMDVMRADMILVNFLGAKKVSIGTVMEIAWADALRKPIVLVMRGNNVHSHSMIEEVSGFIVPDLDQAISVVTAVLSPTL